MSTANWILYKIVQSLVETHQLTDYMSLLFLKYWRHKRRLIVINYWCRSFQGSSCVKRR